MKKITNSVKIVVPAKSKDAKSGQQAKMQVKESLSEIQRLSQEIDMQISSTKYGKASNSSHVSSYDNKNKSLNQSKVNEQVGQDYEQEDSNYWPPQKNHKNMNQESTTISIAVEQSLKAYIFQQTTQSRSKQEQQVSEGYEGNQSSHMVDIDSYEEYKRVKSNNKNFKEIVSNLQAFRRLSLSMNEPFELKNESELLALTHKCVSRQAITKQSQRNQQGLRAIQKLEEIQQAIENRLQAEKDSIEHKKRIVEELRTNQKSLKEDIELLQSRNLKLQKQLNSLNFNKQKYENSSSQQQEEEEKHDRQRRKQTENMRQDSDSDEQKPKQLNIKPTSTEPKHQTQTLPNIQQPIIDYQQEYLQLMTHYQLYNPQTQQIQQSFPKNKTQAMMLLNRLQTKIQQLEILKLTS